ncbi:hypothetical protein CEXT_151871 [Caerostris extrusa]|uniref:Uncharacterized protein n=1 Tax=Caerostris extrusa TaxID=172846 RepID=A0AAV4XYB4_CAEEX|nr:hypothetical protein CEXT_151871 [Caerostris extrusa]
MKVHPGQQLEKNHLSDDDPRTLPFPAGLGGKSCQCSFTGCRETDRKASASSKKAQGRWLEHKLWSTPFSPDKSVTKGKSIKLATEKALLTFPRQGWPTESHTTCDA